MKAHTDQLVSINEIVNGVLADLGEGSQRKDQMLKWAVDYYRRYRMDIAREVKGIRVTMTPYKAVILPKDCVDWLELGIENGNQLNTFVNKKLLSRECACDQEAPVNAKYYPESGSEGVQYYNLTEYGENPGKQYGLSVKDNGLGYLSPSRVDRVNEIQLSADVDSTAVIRLIYLSTLFDPSHNNIVHPYAQDLIAYGCHYNNLFYRWSNGNRNISPTAIQMAKGKLDEEICLVAERRFDLRYEDIIEVIREGRRLSPHL